MKGAVKIKKLRNILTFLITLAVIVYVVKKIGVTQIAETISSISLKWFILGFIVYVINYVFRTFRFRFLIHSKKIGFLNLFKISCFHSMFNYLMPARSGELSYIYFLKKNQNISLGEGVATLFIARVLDLLIVALVLPFILYALKDKVDSSLLNLSRVFLIVLFFIAVLIVFFSIRGRKVLDFLNRSRLKSSVNKYRAVKFIDALVTRLQVNFETIYFNKVYHYAMGLTILIWLSVYTYFYLVVRSLGAQMSILTIVFISFTMMLVRLLPIQGVGNFGTHEAGWVGVLMMFGVSQGEALRIAFGTHVLILVFVLGLAGIAKLAIK